MLLCAECKGWPWVQTVAVHATNCVIETGDPATVFKIGDRVSSRRPRIVEHEDVPGTMANSPRPERQ